MVFRCSVGVRWNLTGSMGCHVPRVTSISWMCRGTLIWREWSSVWHIMGVAPSARLAMVWCAPIRMSVGGLGAMSVETLMAVTPVVIWTWVRSGLAESLSIPWAMPRGWSMPVWSRCVRLVMACRCTLWRYFVGAVCSYVTVINKLKLIK